MQHNGFAFVFINFEQAAGFGHIGWGFHIAGDRYYFGSTDHLWRRRYPLWHPLELVRYMDVQPANNNDYWAKLGTLEQMLITMRSGRHVRYHAYKCLQVTDPDPLTAKAYADTMKDGGWNVWRNNCVHQSYNILTKYGARSLPSPFKMTNRFPRKWFESIAADEVILTPSTNKEIFPAVLGALDQKVS
ncbi:MAG: hypothetical protein ACRD3W_14625 [Terriglobales bacterium]